MLFLLGFDGKRFVSGKTSAAWKLDSVLSFFVVSDLFGAPESTFVQFFSTETRSLPSLMNRERGNSEVRNRDISSGEKEVQTVKSETLNKTAVNDARNLLSLGQE